MQTLQKLVVCFMVCVSLFFILAQSSSEHVKPTPSSHTSNRNHIQNKLNNKKLGFEIKLHGILLWASMGFLIPVGILAIRMSHREECGKRLKILFYVHSISQIVSVAVATAGAVMSIRNFNNAFNNHHQRIGIGLYGVVWLQAFIGLLRPHRGSKARSAWFFLHWMLGTAVSLLGVINVYTGLQAYQQKTSKSIRIWTIVFTTQMSLIVFFYLMQDKWVYMQKQGLILGTTSEPVRIVHQVMNVPSPDKHKESTAEPC